MSRIHITLICTIAMLLCAGCSQESSDATAYRRHAEQLAHQNRRLQNSYDGASTLLTVSNIALVITGGGLAVCLWNLLRRKSL